MGPGMPSHDSSGPRPAQVVLRIKLRYEDLDAMVHRFAPNVGKSGLFLPTKSLQPIGAEIKFELRLADDKPVLVGLGRVKAVKEPDPANPKASFGMAIELMRVTRESRDLIMRMLERRKQLGLAEVAIPMPTDIEMARRSEVVETAVSAPAPRSMPIAESVAESLLSSPRVNSGSFASAKPLAQLAPFAPIAPLAPEGPRRKRMAVSEIIESASGPISAVQMMEPALDDDLDIAAVLARARALAGANIDGELASLLEVAAAPVEISIEAASAELARQLGGAAVSRRDRARWSPPPATVAAQPPIADERTPADSRPQPAVASPALALVTAEGAGDVTSTTSGSIAVAQPEAAEPLPEQAAADQAVAELLAAELPALERLPELPAAEPFLAAPTQVDDLVSSPVHMIVPGTEPEPEPEPDDEDDINEVDPDQIADEIHQLSEADFEEVEHTQLGGSPVEPSAFEHHAFVTEPGAGSEELVRRLDAELAEAGLEAASEADPDAEADDLGTGTGNRPLGAPEIEARNSADLAHDDEPDPEPAPEPPGDEIDEEPEEIDDFEIIAEADAGDDDLLAAHGEHEVSGSHRTVVPGSSPPSLADFASRLDLGDDSGHYTPGDGRSEFPDRHAIFSEPTHDNVELDPRMASAGQALAALAGFDDDDDERIRAPSQFDEPATYDPPPDSLDTDSGYTFAGEMPPASIEFDSGHIGFPIQHDFDQSDVVVASRASAILAPHDEPFLRRGSPSEEASDLETALEALDVDLDDLSLPHQPVELVRDRETSTGVRKPGSSPMVTSPSRQGGPAGIARAPRALSDDGIEIDFEDDDEL